MTKHIALLAPLMWIVSTWATTLTPDNQVRLFGCASIIIASFLPKATYPIVKKSGFWRLLLLWGFFIVIWTWVAWLAGVVELLTLLLGWIILSLAPIVLLAKWDRIEFFGLLRDLPGNRGILLSMAAIERVLIDGAEWFFESVEYARIHRINGCKKRAALSLFVAQPIIFALELLEGLVVTATARQLAGPGRRIRGTVWSLEGPMSRLVGFGVLALCNIVLVLSTWG